MDSGRDPAVLLEQGRYGELLTTLDSSSRSAETLIWAVRCRVEQGYVRAAAELVKKPPSPARASCDASTALRLWRGFLTLYENGDRPVAEIVAEFRAQCEEIAIDASAPVSAHGRPAVPRGNVSFHAEWHGAAAPGRAGEQPAAAARRGPVQVDHLVDVPLRIERSGVLASTTPTASCVSLCESCGLMRIPPGGWVCVAVQRRF